MKITKTKLLLAFLLVLVAVCAVFTNVAAERGSVAIVVVSTPTAGPLNTYIQTIQQDNAQRIQDFKASGVQDYSGLGYSACIVSSDCLSGEQTCKAGTIPNTQTEPGYCVPNGK